MTTQLTLIEGDFSCKKKRVRYEIPHYKKVYSVYQYDQAKYMDIWRRIRELAIKLNKPNIYFKVSPYAVLRHCYVKENGEKKHLGDERHIFRYSTLYKIESRLFNYSRAPLNLNATREISWQKHGVLFFYDYDDGGFATIAGTEDLPIKQRVKIHVQLLRNLRSGMEFRKAVRLCRMKPLR
jgi:hypothetical protein